MELVIDEKKWAEAFLDTPFGRPQDPKSAHDAMKTPSCGVKSKERDERKWPKHTGQLVAYDEPGNRVIVRGYGDAVSPKFVWTGSVAEYFGFWDCD